MWVPPKATAEIKNHTVDKKGDKYEIELKTENKTWTVHRYYDDFHTFQLRILKKHPVEAGLRDVKRVIPFLPGKFFTPGTFLVTDAMFEKRKRKLDAYVKAMMEQGENLRSCRYFIDFFEFRK
eukprot:Colp12_sorted_trinity150504_noHs@21757